MTLAGKSRSNSPFLGLSPVQWLVVSVVLVAGGAGGYLAFDRFLNAEDSTGNRQLLPVERGDISQTVSTSGSVEYATTESVTFGASGTVGEVLVSAGDTVSQGDPIARLDAASVGSLERAVHEAEIALRTAQEKVTNALAPADALALSQARADLETAKSALRDAERATDAGLRRAVAEAETALASANAKVTDLAAPSELAMSQAQADLLLAKASLKKAQLALDDHMSGSTAATAAQALADARNNMAAAEKALADAETTHAEKVAAARETLQEAELFYSGLMESWLGIDAPGPGAATSPDSLVQAWGTTYDAIVEAAKADNARGVDDTATPWDEQAIYYWVRLTPTLVVGTCPVKQGSETLCLQSELTTAWDAMSPAMTAYENALALQETAVANAKSALAKSKDAVTSAQRNYDDIASDAMVQSRQADLAVAKARLAEAQKKYDTVSKVDASALAAARAQAEEAKSKLQSASETLEAFAVTRQNSLAVARARVAAAEEKLADLEDIGKDDLAVALARSQAIEAETRLAAAKEALNSSTLPSPITGVVLSVGVSAGQSVNPNTVVAEVADPSVLVVQGVVDEIDVLSVSVGSPAVVRMDALSGAALNGTVTEISNSPNSQNGVVNYPIKVTIDVPEGLALRQGLSATATVVIGSDSNALLVPLAAIGGSFVQPTLNVVRDGREQTVDVQLGISDESWVAVRQGLRDGDRVVLETSAASAAADTRLQRNATLGQGTQLFGAGNGQPQIFIAPGGAGQFQGFRQGAGGQQGTGAQPGGTGGTGGRGTQGTGGR